MNIKLLSLIVAIFGVFVQPTFSSASEVDAPYDWSNAGTENGEVHHEAPVLTSSVSSNSYAVLAGAAALAVFGFVAIMSSGVQTVQVPGRTKYVSNTMYLRLNR